MRVLVNIARLILGAVLLFSGYVKAIDPLGTLYKMEDYLAALGMAGALPSWAVLIAAIALAALEFTLGVCVLLAIRRRLTAHLVVALMTVMTLLSVWIVAAEPVEDCGCFGDAIRMTPWETLSKNLALLALATAVWMRPSAMARLISQSNQWIAFHFTLLYILATSLLSLYTLPRFDFRPYHVGANILSGMQTPPGAKTPRYETTFTLEKGGERREFTIDDYPDSTWQFVDSHTVMTEPGYQPPIHDFSILRRSDGQDITREVLTRPGYTFLLISPHLEVADDTNFGDIDRIYEYAQAEGIPFYCLTASPEEAIQRWQGLTGAEYTFCTTDETTLRTIIRSNPGLLLLRQGTVWGKWSHNALPTEADLQPHIDRAPIAVQQDTSTWRNMAAILLWFVLPLTLLCLIDRTWAWSQWVRHRIDKVKPTLIKHKAMRKKIVAGNWKMNLNLQEGVALAKEINAALQADKPACDVVICTPFVHLASVAQELDSEVVGLGAENCADKAKGAYTGEVSAAMVKSTGAQYVILGHSERRQYYAETAEILREKVLLALENGLKVIFCCGETLEEREAGTQNEVVKAELQGSVFNLSAEEWKNIILAYEPIWAIGTGKTATSDQAQEMLAYIRSIVAEKYGEEAAEDTSILYGGSCKASNAPELFAKPDIDGGLIGGASLRAADFKGIIDAWKK